MVSKILINIRKRGIREKRKARQNYKTKNGFRNDIQGYNFFKKGDKTL